MSKSRQEKLEEECLELAKELHERFVYLDAPKKLVVNLTGEDHEWVMCAVQEAKNYLGTPHKSKAIVHIADEYLTHGPRCRAVKSIELKAAIREEALERQMRELGPEAVMEIYKKAFPEEAQEVAFDD